MELGRAPARSCTERGRGLRERKGRRRRELERNKEMRHGVLPAAGADEGSCGGRTHPGDREEVVGWIGGLVGGGCEWRGEDLDQVRAWIPRERSGGGRMGMGQPA